MTYCLKAMRYGCRTAVQRFPRLLQLLKLYPATTTDFKKKVVCLFTDCGWPHVIHTAGVQHITDMFGPQLYIPYTPQQKTECIQCVLAFFSNANA